MTRRAVVGLILVALALAGCGDDESPSAADAAADATGDTAVDATADTVADAGADPDQDEEATEDAEEDVIDIEVGDVDPALVGSYDVISFTSGGQEVTQEPQTTPEGISIRMEGTVDLRGDGYDLSVEIFIDEESSGPSEDSGTWGINGDLFILDSELPETQTLVFTYQMSGDTLTLTGEPGNPVNEMVLERTN